MMKKGISQRAFRLMLCFLILCIMLITASADTTSKYYMGEPVNTGHDNGFSGQNPITVNDPHFGWTLGEFYLNGHSDVEKDEQGNLVFLKNVGDQLTLWFRLNQDIYALNGNTGLSVCADTNGYDQYFNIARTNFGKGALIIRQKDSENHWGEPVLYTDYLNAKTSTEADTEVELFEEGDYEVALNYEIKQDTVDVFGWKPISGYHNYRIFFRFSVRNGNCMVYPFDIATKEELTNTAFTENGFYLDLAKSKYLNINIKKEILNEGSQGLVEDMRFNKPARDGEAFTDEGIYTITVSNEYTKQETVKKIYVGTNNILKAHVTTGYSVEEINQQISQGAVIEENGELKTHHQSAGQVILYILICFAVVAIIVISLLVFLRLKKKKSESEREGEIDK